LRNFECIYAPLFHFVFGIASDLSACAGPATARKKKNQTEEKKMIHTARPVVNRKLSKIQLNPTKGVKQTFNEGQSEVCAIKIGQ
jgi:PPE-repeat protein